MMTLDEIWQEYINLESLTPQTLKDLIWYIQNDDTSEAFIMVIDMLVGEEEGMLSKKLVPYLARQLDSEDDYERELAVKSLVGRLKLAKYAEKALNMAKNDPESNVIDLAASSLGAVIDKVDFVLRKQIANYIYDSVTSDIYDDLHKQNAYGSVLKAMEVPFYRWPPLRLNPDIPNMINKDLLENFRRKYMLLS